MGKLSRITSHTRRRMCGSSSGSGAPLCSISQEVWAFGSPSRTGTYCSLGVSLPLSSA